MNQPLTSIKRVVIVGGGIAGLSTAYALLEEAKKLGQSIECTVLEAKSHWGGKILTKQVNGLLVEGGPDSFLTTKPWALGLCEKLGLSEQLINTNQGQTQTFAYSRGQLREFPQGLVSMVPTKLGPLFKSGLVSWPGIMRMAGDWFIPPRQVGAPEESLANFFCRRLGQEAFDRLIEPLVAGIYAGDASELSVSATFPQFVDLEMNHGGLIKGALAQQQVRRTAQTSNGPRRSLFVTLQGGLSDLVARLVEVLATSGVILLTGKNVEETACPRCHETKADRLMSAFASQVKGDHKPGFAEMKAYDMYNDRMDRFKKLPPLIGGARPAPGEPSMTQSTDSGPGTGTGES